MVTREENDLLTRTGPGARMGALLRRYWAPALLAEELPEPDCPPVRVQLLGEELLAFRDSEGTVGLIDRHCAHRGASLFFGRNEECGIRCVYHGWKYDVHGNCIDMPNEPPETRFKEKVHLTAYPCREMGGVIWTYMGPGDRVPDLPDFEWAGVPEGQRCVSKRLQDCNYLQALEGGVDLSHISFLHRSLDPEGDRADQQLARQDSRPKFEIVDTDYGLVIAARRDANPEDYYWRVSQWLMPWYTMFSPLVDRGLGGHAWIPIDDEHCWAFSITWDPDLPVSVEQREAGPVSEGIYGELIPGTFRPRANQDNDYQINRADQRARSFTGIPGFSAQDCAVQESMGPLYDRGWEHLGNGDLPIIALRRRLLQALRELEAGTEPPGLDGTSYRVRPAALCLPKGVSLQQGAGDALRAPLTSG